MNDASVELQGLLDRIRQGDRAARRELVDRSCDRIRRLAARLMHGSFPAVEARHDLDSVVHETWLRLVQALETTEPPTVADFFRLAAHKIRQVLLDMIDRQRRRAAREIPETIDHGNQTYDPARLALWTEFHQRVEQLPEDERTVFEMHHYLGLPQAEIARTLDLHPRKVSYLWIAATEKLADGLERENGLS